MEKREKMPLFKDRYVVNEQTNERMIDWINICFWNKFKLNLFRIDVIQ